MEVPEDAAEAEPFAVQYSHIISLASIFPSCLKLTIGAPIILLPNQRPREDLYNSTKMKVLGIRLTCLQVAIIGRKIDTKIYLLPGNKLTTTDDELPLTL